MGEKLDARYEFGYELPEEGVHVFVVNEPKANVYDCKDKDGQVHGKGYSFAVKCVVDGGASDGLYHFENWRSRWPDGKVNTKAMSALYGFLIKLGVKKPGGIDTDEIENEKFMKGFETIAGKPVGLEIFHSKDKQDKVWSRSKAYYTVAEAKEKMGKVVSKPAGNPTPAKENEGW